MTVVAFLVVLTVLVTVHEFGHFAVARMCGVRVEVFSIGFGPELFGFNDRHGTRWRVACVPLGGYVRMFGDADAASRPDTDGLDGMTDGERSVSFHHKPVGVRAAVIAAGPLANFLFAIVALTLLFSTVGQPFSAPTAVEVTTGTAAERGGFLPGDEVVDIDGSPIFRFEDIRRVVALNPGRTVSMIVRRDGKRVELSVTLDTREFTDRFGNVQRMGALGIRGGAPRVVVHPPLKAVGQAGREVWGMVVGTFQSLGQIIDGSRGTEELGGPIRIAQMSGAVAEIGLVALINFMAFLSVNLGLINLFPVPILDGGHLLFHAIEAVFRKPLSPRTQEYGFRIGLALVITLMVFVTWNDIVQLKVVDFVRGLIS